MEKVNGTILNNNVNVVCTVYASEFKNQIIRLSSEI